MSNDKTTTVLELRKKIAEFVSEREWERFHTPKNLAESICIKAAELLEIFQWVGSKESREFAQTEKNKERIREELADVVIYCLSMANSMNFDLSDLVAKKMRKNADKYPKKKLQGKTRT